MRKRAKSSVAPSHPYEPWLKDRLASNPEEATRYLEAALADDEPQVFLLALKDVVDAYGGVAQLSEITGLNRENLYRMLSNRGNPEFFSLVRVLEALGLRLHVNAAPPSRLKAFVGGARRLLRKKVAVRSGRMSSQLLKELKAQRSRYNRERYGVS